MRALLWVLLTVSASGQTDFRKDVAPILEQSCLSCHSAAKAAGGLALTSRKALLDKKAIVAGAAESSPLYTLSALGPGHAGAMPPGGPPLSPG